MIFRQNLFSPVGNCLADLDSSDSSHSMPSGEFPFTKFLIPEVGPEQHTNIKDREETEVTNDGDDETEIPCSYCRCGKILHSFAAVNSLVMSNHA